MVSFSISKILQKLKSDKQHILHKKASIECSNWCANAHFNKTFINSDCRHELCF